MTSNRVDFAGGIAKVAVIGSGTMGAQITCLVATSGRHVAIFDSASEALERAQSRIENEILPALEASNKFSGDAKTAVERISYCGSLDDAVASVDLAIEAVREDLDVKRGVFADLSRLAPNAILASNSSSIPSALFADAVSQPERLLNTHFFAPVWVRSMLEIMSCGDTNEETMLRAQAFGNSLDLVTAMVRGQSKGFIINRIWRAVKRESLRVVDEGVAEPEDVDRLWMNFFQTQYAPFGIMDMVGLDVVRDIEWSYQRESLDPTDLPSTTLARMIETGSLGEKTGSGFYTHPDPAYLNADFRGRNTDD